MKKFNESTGITLIALVVTIVILLILAATSISMLTGENGIITQAQEATIKTENGEVYEALLLKLVDNNTDNTINEINKENFDYLLEKGYIDSNNIVNTDKITSSNMRTGKGSLEDGDIYIIKEVEENKYVLVYVNNEKEETNLGELFEENINLVLGREPTSEEYFDFDSNTGGIAIKDACSYYDYSKNYDFSKKSPIEEIVIPKFYGGKKVTCIGFKQKDTTFIGNYTFTAGFATPNIKRIYMSNNIVKLENRVGEERGLFAIPTLEEIVLSDNIEYLPDRTFSECEKLNNIELPSKLKEIGTNAFYGCSSLTNINIPSSVTSIGEDTFNGCSSLTNIEIPSSVTSIEQSAFYRCNSLTTVNYTGTKAEWNILLSSISYGNDDLINAKIICTDGEIN